MADAPYIKCRKGDFCNFDIEYEGGLDAAYTQARFIVRMDWDEALSALIDVDQDSMDFDRTDPQLGKITVRIGASLTASLPAIKQPTFVAAMIHLINPIDADDRKSDAIPFQLQPIV